MKTAVTVIFVGIQKIARLCRKERTIHGFVLARTPVFLLLTHPQISSRERRLVAIFNKLTIANGFAGPPPVEHEKEPYQYNEPELVEK
jgi:hypothetical protein